MSGLHTEATDGDIHTPFRWIWADAAARNAETDINSNDVNKVGLQSDNHSLWVLEDLTPTWTQIGGGGITVEFTVGTQAGDSIIVEMQVYKNGVAVDEEYAFPMILSDDLPPTTTATPPTGGIAIWDNGVIFTQHITNIYIEARTNSLGNIDFEIEDTGTPTFYLSAIMPDGTISSSEAITFA